MKIFLIYILAITSCFAQKDLNSIINKYNDHSVPYISTVALQQKLSNKESIVLLDAREPKEILVSTIPTAIPIGAESFSIKAFSKKYKDKDALYIVYCSLGIRSEHIAKQIKNAGYTNVRNLYGGIFKWKNDNFDVQNNLNKPTDSIHTYTKEWSIWLTNGIPVYEQ